MAKKVKVFVDSDIIISAQLSSAGAAHFLLNKTNLSLFVSNLSLVELKRVAARHKINNDKLLTFIKLRFSQVRLTEGFKEIEGRFRNYTNDPDDIHIVAGAVRANVEFLLTYNLRDYKIDEIKKDLGIIIITPASFLQYLRSRV